MKTHTFRVVLEPDEEGWHIYVPELESIGASTWGYTKEGALYYIKEVLEMIIEEFEEEGLPLPPETAADSREFLDARPSLPNTGKGVLRGGGATRFTHLLTWRGRYG